MCTCAAVSISEGAFLETSYPPAGLGCVCFARRIGPELSGIRVNSYVVAAAAAPNQQARSYTTRVTIANASCHQKLVDMLAC